MLYVQDTRECARIAPLPRSRDAANDVTHSAPSHAKGRSSAMAEKKQVAKRQQTVVKVGASRSPTISHRSMSLRPESKRCRMTVRAETFSPTRGGISAVRTLTYGNYSPPLRHVFLTKC